MPTPLIDFSGGPGRCFADYQKVIECVTNAKTTDNSVCDMYKHDYMECRRHRVEMYKMFIMKKHLEETGQLDKLDEIGAPYIKNRSSLTPKTLGLVDGEDTKLAHHRY